MQTSFPRSILLAALVGLSCSTAAGADPALELPPEDAPPFGFQREKQVSRHDWTLPQLAAGVASPNMPPLMRDGSGQGFISLDLISDTYDPSKQEVVFGCLTELVRRQANAIPTLVDRLNDDRYALTVYYEDENKFRNYRVRHVCWNALRCLLEPSVSRSESETIRNDPCLSYCRQVLRDRTGALRWLAERRGRSLAALQLESLQWLERQPKRRLLPATQRNSTAELIRELRHSREPIVPDVSRFAPSFRLLIMSFATRDLPLADGGRFRCWFQAISDSGVVVVRFDKRGRELWRHYCKSLNMMHSEYSHEAHLKMVDRRLQVTSIGSAGTFVESLDPQTGRQLQRKQPVIPEPISSDSQIP